MDTIYISQFKHFRNFYNAEANYESLHVDEYRMPNNFHTQLNVNLIVPSILRNIQKHLFKPNYLWTKYTEIIFWFQMFFSKTKVSFEFITLFWIILKIYKPIQLALGVDFGQYSIFEANPG